MYCKACHYCLWGLEGGRSCPECGSGFDPEDDRSFRREKPDWFTAYRSRLAHEVNRWVVMHFVIFCLHVPYVFFLDAFEVDTETWYFVLINLILGLGHFGIAFGAFMSVFMSLLLFKHRVGFLVWSWIVGAMLVMLGVFGLFGWHGVVSFIRGL